MKTLVIDETKARNLYHEAPTGLRAELEKTFGTEFFSEKITDRIKTMIDVYKALDLDPTAALPYPGTKDPEEHAINSFRNVTLIAKVLNEGWTPDWTDEDQDKYWPWFDMSSGSGLVYLSYGCSYASSIVGSRLCFRTRELAEYAGRQFLKVYKGFMI
jgi:hypothetical protein